MLGYPLVICTRGKYFFLNQKFCTKDQPMLYCWNFKFKVNSFENSYALFSYFVRLLIINLSKVYKFIVVV